METYSVQLDVFCGPLDLLLQLIKSDEIEISRVSLAKVADQFVTYLKSIEFSDLEIAADFIVVACHLMEIKSRELLPEEERGEEAGELEELDTGSDLIKKLLEYRAFKEVSRILGQRAKLIRRRHPRGTVPDLPSVPVDLEAVLADVTLWDMVSAFVRIAREVFLEGMRKIVYDDIPIGDHIENILAHLGTHGDAEFSVLVRKHREKSRVIGAFLALLELVKQKLIRIRQEEDFGEIRVEKTDPAQREREEEEEVQPGPPAPIEEGPPPPPEQQAAG